MHVFMRIHTNTERERKGGKSAPIVFHPCLGLAPFYGQLLFMKVGRRIQLLVLLFDGARPCVCQWVIAEFKIRQHSNYYLLANFLNPTVSDRNSQN